jgi:hypothetical protein
MDEADGLRLKATHARRAATQMLDQEARAKALALADACDRQRAALAESALPPSKRMPPRHSLAR